MKRALMGLLAFVCICASAHDLDIHDAAAVTAAVTVTGDEYSKVSIYRAPRIGFNFDSGHMLVPNDTSTVDLSIGCMKSDGVCSNGTFDVDVHYSDSSWRFIQNAAMPGGDELPVTPVAREVIDCFGDGTCLYDEAVMVELPAGYLQAHVQDGLNIKVGQHVYTLPGTYIAGLIATIKPPNHFPSSNPVSAASTR